MFRIEHIAVWTNDIERLAAFYQAQFGAVVGDLYVNPSKGFSSRFLRFGEGARLEIMSSVGLTDAPDRSHDKQVGIAHLAICVGTDSDVDAMTHRLAAAGVKVLSPPRRTGDGYYESVVRDPDGNTLEICAS